MNGNLMAKIPINIGVKQGCILAPHLFSLFLNDLADHFKGINGHPPFVGKRPTPLLLYADDAVILSRTRVGLIRYLRTFIDYCLDNKLTINYDKTKILVFAKTHYRYHWQLRGKQIQQINHFRYLGINFSLLWRRVVKQPFETLPTRLGVQSPAAGSRLTQPSILPRSVNEYPAYLLGGKERLGKALANHPV